MEASRCTMTESAATKPPVIKGATVRDERTGFEFIDGGFSTSLFIPSTDQDDEWRKINDASLGEYQIHHRDAYPEEIATIQKLFAGFIARHVRGDVLDVGCGMGAEIPMYARGIPHIRYFGIDPINSSAARDYPFICARIEDALPILSALRFDGFIFATSLDHLRDPAYAARMIRALATPGARAVFWIGLHEPAMVAREIGATLLPQFFTPLTWPSSWYKSLRWQILSFPRLMLALRRRERSLRMGMRLDELHFHYFTAESARATLISVFGDIVEELAVPGTNTVFYCVSVDTDTTNPCAE